MNVNKPIKNTGLKIEKFLEFRNGLSSEDKKLEAGVLIEEIKTINVDSAYHKVSSRIKTQSQTTRFITIITRVAAVLTLPLLAFTDLEPVFSAKTFRTGSKRNYLVRNRKSGRNALTRGFARWHRPVAECRKQN
jgi:hypothetical protein